MSRLYMGVHSVADLITGLAISAGAQWLLIGRGWESYINAWIYESSSGPLVPFLSILAFLRFYPSTTPWSASFATASELFGLWAGLCVSYWASINLFPEAGNALMAQSLVRDTCSSIVPIAMSWSQRILRVSSGMVMVFVTRIVTKKISTNLMLWLLRLGITSVSKEQAVDSEGMSVLLEHAYVVEPPRRILGLLLTTAMCVLGAPWIWNQMGI
jgi:hypothetical protein